MIELACPDCHTSLDGRRLNDCCLPYRREKNKRIPDLMTRNFPRDAAYLFEVSRYEAIAQAGPENYAGYAESKPVERALIMQGLLEEAGVTEFVNVGPGFGVLEEITDSFERTAVDACQNFLRRIKENHPEIRCVRGVAERLPLATSCVPCLVADSIFQSIVDRERFLYEVGRVCTADARLFLTVAYVWNYPRRPQNGFNVLRADERKTLRRFLEELGFEVDFRVMNLDRGHWADRAGDLDDGDCLYIVGERRS